MRYILPPLLAAIILTAVAAVSVGLQQAFLAPSLGAAALSQTLHADEKSAAPYDLAVGRIIGGIAGFAGVRFAEQARAHPRVGTHDLPAGRILAVALAVCGQMVAGARTSTGGAIALGLAGIARIMVLGEAARRIILETKTTEAA